MDFAGNFNYDIDRSNSELIKVRYYFGTSYRKVTYIRKDRVAYQSAGDSSEGREMRNYGTYGALNDATLAAKVFKELIEDDFLAWFDVKYYAPHIGESE